MNKYSIGVVCLSMLAFIAGGCGPKIAPRGEMTEVQGKITDGTGAPIGDLSVTLQPLEDGHMTTMIVSPEGKFQGKMIPGKYAFFVVKNNNPESIESLKRVQSKYHEASMENTVLVKSGEEIQITCQ